MEKFMKILKKFYLVFTVCVLTFVVAGAMYIYNYVNDLSLNKISYTEPVVYKDETKDETTPVTTTENDIKKESIKEETKPVKKAEIKTDSINVMSVLNSENIIIEKPVNNKVLNKFTGDRLIYSKTFEDYRVHNGIDIKAQRGDAVKCVFDGVVEEIDADALYGITITVNHGNGYKSVYKNLSTDKMVRKGEPVKKGQVISGVGETAIFEAAEDSHIHFELMYNSKQVNPEEYFG